MPRMRTMNRATASEPMPRTCRQHHEKDEGDEGGEHEDVAMREVDHADDAEHHGVADGDQAVDGAQRHAVDHLLQEIFHVRRRFDPSVAHVKLAGPLPTVIPQRRLVIADTRNAIRDLAARTGRWVPDRLGCASTSGDDGWGRPPSEHVVGAVAEGLVVGALAAAQIEGARAFRHEAVRLQGAWPCASRRRRAAWPSARRCTRSRASQPRG